EAGEVVEDQALAAAGSPRDDMKPEIDRPGQVGHDAAPVFPVTASEHRGAPADPGHHGGERAGAVAAAPAVDERPPFAWAVGEALFDQVGDIARNNCRSLKPGLEGRALLVDGADAGALL